eukprot:CAMPEP_0196584756 /NCGR_PEP_ID=MMETSP1081-20130531/48356_1 /TAXON_ID=36882 /ORGANISM="Pyramimonas amylifera, Strain CCMP720" /LENGTH=618 /DNA_ID=CAMNT_0041906083 /DNA_START=228 /DNA_END=2085 /DNA_ORIENTATION=+
MAYGVIATAAMGSEATTSSPGFLNNSTGEGTLDDLSAAADHSWLRDLSPDPETEKYEPNHSSRQVRSGHYVLVRPTPLPAPSLVTYSPEMAALLNLSPNSVEQDPRFALYFAGHWDQVPGLQTWCTPYALSIMGTPQVHNCPFGTGNGYGDGRAISVGEVEVRGQRWEMQIKGAGRTPFCRGGDGRAVLRSSVREFLASEAMHHLGVSTTRALSLVVSQKETTGRPWYSPLDASDPRLVGYSEAEKKELLSQPRDPDMMITEKCAATTRVAPSFLRVGHVDLFARRAADKNATEEQKEQLRQIVEHAIQREFGAEVGNSEAPLEERARAMLRAASKRVAQMTAGWLRVGFCQGNFNADNCLVGGRTMDYGPFGWMDRYDPLFAKWTGSGRHFAFMNQPTAALANLQVLAQSISGVLGPSGRELAGDVMSEAADVMEAEVEEVWRLKLGLPEGSSHGKELWDTLEPLMRRSEVDWTVFWRQLACVAELPEDALDDSLLQPLEMAFYTPPLSPSSWVGWLRTWRSILTESLGSATRAQAVMQMRASSPKFVPREWMLVEAYNAANKEDYSILNEQFDLYKSPYDEHEGAMSDKYYRRAPDKSLMTGGTTFMADLLKLAMG